MWRGCRGFRDEAAAVAAAGRRRVRAAPPPPPPRLGYLSGDGDFDRGSEEAAAPLPLPEEDEALFDLCGGQCSSQERTGHDDGHTSCAALHFSYEKLKQYD